MDKTFSQLVVIGKDGHLELCDPERGSLAVAGSAGYTSSLEAIQELMRRTGASSRREDHELMGAGVREPIRQLARYKQWTQIFFSDWPLDPTEDNRIPLDNPVGMAFISSPEGRPLMIDTGVQLWTRPSFFEVKAGLQVFWKQLQTAGWPVMRRRLEEVADDMARKQDAAAKRHLDAAIASVVGHATTIAGGLLTKVGIDAVLKAAAQINFPITQAAINPARLMDMTNWTNGSTSALPYFWSPQQVQEQVFKQLYAEGYGNIRWFVSHSVPMTEIYLAGEPQDIGYHQNHGQATSASDIDIELGVDKHVIREESAYYVGNAYNLWKITINS